MTESWVFNDADKVHVYEATSTSYRTYFRDGDGTWKDLAWQKAVAPVWKTLGEDVVGPEVMVRLKKIGAQHAK